MKEVSIDKNQWHERDDLQELIDFIRLASKEKVYSKEGNFVEGNNYWSWAKNMRCKYVTIRFDMRDGAFVLCDKDGNRITLEDLKFQYGEVEYK